MSTGHQGETLSRCHEAYSRPKYLAAVVWGRAFATAADANVGGVTTGPADPAMRGPAGLWGTEIMALWH